MEYSKSVLFQNTEQTSFNKRSKKKCQNFVEAERKFQEAQSAWESNINNKEAWNTMFFLIQSAVFNSVNKKLEKTLDKGEIEERSLDITITIMERIKRNREANKSWKISKVSSYVHQPCLAIYQKSLQFWDSLVWNDTYTMEELLEREINEPNY